MFVSVFSARVFGLCFIILLFPIKWLNFTLY